MRIILSFCLCFCLCAVGALAAPIEWKLSQKHAEFGQVTILVVPDAVKIINSSLKYEILAKAPAWDVVMYRTAEKKQCTMKRDYFVSTRVFKFLHPPRSLVQMQFTKLDKSKLDDVELTHLQDPGDKAELWVSNNIKVQRAAIDIVEAYYNIKPSPGMPLRLILFLRDKKKLPINSWFNGGLNMGYQGKTTFLKTDEAKKIPYDASDFIYPKNFANAKSPEDLMLSKGQEKSFDNLMDDMGLGSKWGESKKATH